MMRETNPPKENGRMTENHADNPLKWAFMGEMIVKALRAGLNSSSGHMWPLSALVCPPLFYII